MSWPLEPDRRTIEQWLEVLGGVGLDLIEQTPRSTALGTTGARGIALAEETSVTIGEQPLPGGPQRIRALLADAIQAALVTTGPGYWAYIPGGGLPAAAVADFVAGCTNRYTGLSAAAPGPCRLEADVLAWLTREFGYDEQAWGIFTSGGSMANFSAIVTARHHHLGDHGDFRTATAYTSSQVHHSVRKSLRLAGIPPSNLRAVAVDDRLRMDPDALTEQIRADRNRGFHPFLVVSSAGTTNTGAIDPMTTIGSLCRSESVWHHVDGAYGGAFVLCDSGRERLAGISEADSITFDPHKGLFLPYGTGCLLVRDGRILRAAHSATAGYLQDFDTEDRTGEPPSPNDYGPELSRDYRGLRVWLPLMLHGARSFRQALAEKLELAATLHRGLQALVQSGAELEIVDPPQLSVVSFRLRRRRHEPLPQWNERNAGFLQRINAAGRVYLSSTNLPVEDGEAFTLRGCVLSFRTHRERIEQGLDDIERALETAE